MAKKTKAAALKPLQSWAEVDAELAEMNELVLRSRATTSEYEPRIRQLTEEQDKLLQPLTEALESRDSAIKDWVNAHLDDFAHAKTKRLTAGQVSVRAASLVEIADMDATVAALRHHGLTECIKETAKPIAAALRQLSPELQALCGVEAVTTHKITVEPLAAQK